MGTASSILPLPPAPAHDQEHHDKAKHSQQQLLHQLQDNSLTNQLEHSEGEIFAPSASRPSFFRRSLLMLKRPEKMTKTITIIDPGALCVPYVRRYPFLDFRFEKKVGKSRSCTVHRAVPLREVYAEQVAIKETKVEHRTTQCEDLWYELNILSQLSHPNLMQLHAIYEPYDSHGKCYIVLEYLRGGELVPNLIARKKFSFLDILAFFQQVAAALAYLHGLGIVFGNLLPENIVFLDKFDPNDRLANVVKLVSFERMEFLAAGHRRPLPRGHDDDPSLFFPQPEPQRAATSLEGDELSAAASSFFHFDDRRRLLQLRQADDVWQFGELFYFLLAGRFSREVKPFAHRVSYPSPPLLYLTLPTLILSRRTPSASTAPSGSPSARRRNRFSCVRCTSVRCSGRPRRSCWGTAGSLPTWPPPRAA